MRLSERCVCSIRMAVREIVGDADIWLFGSRADDARRGGDVDLYVEARRHVSLRERLRLMSRIQKSMGLRRVDVIIRDPESRERPIFRTARDTGIRL